MNSNYNYKFAKQQDLDSFLESAIMDENIYPYLSVTKSSDGWTEKKNDWEGINITNDRRSFMLIITFDRRRDEMNIALFALNEYSAGRAILIVKEMIKRYMPRAVNSVVHASNFKSIKMHRILFGAPWGIEESVAWNSAKGAYEDLYYFRKLIS